MDKRARLRYIGRVFTYTTVMVSPRPKTTLQTHPQRCPPCPPIDDIRILDIILTPESIPDLAFLLTHCSRLYELGLSAQGVFTLPPSVPSANIRALRLVECSVQSPILYDLLALFPTVRFLTVGTEIVAPPPPTAMIPAPALYELALKRSLRVDILTWILANSLGSLRILELMDLPSADMKDVLRPHGPYIHSLRIFRFSYTALSILRSCINLKEFVLSSLPVMGPSLDNLPRSIEHFNLNSHALSTPWSPFIPLIVLLPLKTFTCDKGSRSQPGFDTIERLCRTHGVALFADASNFWPVRLLSL